MKKRYFILLLCSIFVIICFILNNIINRKVALAKEDYFTPNSIYYLNVLNIFGENPNGEVLCTLYNKRNLLGNVLYLLDPNTGEGKILVEAQRPVIYSAEINQDWLVWVERDKYNWDIKAKNIKTGKNFLINTGNYTNLIDDDYPTVTLSKNRIIYDISLINNRKKYTH